MTGTGSNRPIIDIGLNLTNRQFDEDREEVMARARKQQVTKAVITGTSIRASQKAADYARKFPGVLYSTAGIHPHDAKTCDVLTMEQLERLALLPYVVAIGECGLDYDRDFSPREVQRKWFKEQVKLAIKLKMPLFLHERAAFRDFKEILEKNHEVCQRSVVHCFTGTKAELEAYLDLGCYIGITGWICDERRGEHLRSLVKMIPLDKLLIETDAPFLLPRNMNPKPADRRNEPAFLRHISDDIADCIGINRDEFCDITFENTKQLFELTDGNRK